MIASKGRMFHAVITRFSYRHVHPVIGPKTPPWLLTGDPLDPRRLDYRFEVFEVTCAPSVLAQTSQEFDWIIIVDRNLPDRHRTRLRKLLRNRCRTHFHEYEPGQDLGSAHWLQPYIPRECARILTTQLDDDDALPTNFIECLQARAGEQSGSSVVRVAATRRSEQWEILPSSRAPLGYRCAWHRGSWIVSTGMSLVSPMGPAAITVFALNHLIADFWYCAARGNALQWLLLDKWGPGAKRTATARFIAARLDEFQERVRKILGTTSLPEAGGFIDLTENVGAVVISNHFLNDQYLRLLEPKSDRQKIEGPESFPAVPLQFDRLRKNPYVFRKRWLHYVRLLKICLARQRPLRQRIRLLAWASWRYIHL
jgi:hypothetical protein